MMNAFSVFGDDINSFSAGTLVPVEKDHLAGILYSICTLKNRAGEYEIIGKPDSSSIPQFNCEDSGTMFFLS